MKGRIFTIAGLLGLSAIFVFGQTPAATLPFVQPSNVSLPDGNGVWVVLVRRTGGFAGLTREVTITSEGKLNCAQCTKEGISRTLSTAALQSATPSFSFGVAPWSPLPPDVPARLPAVSFCMDCFATHITIQRRDAEGKTETYTAAWDDVTTGQWPAEFVKLANTILALAN